MRHLIFIAALTTAQKRSKKCRMVEPLPPIRERHDLGGMLRVRGLTGHGVELGVRAGRFLFAFGRPDVLAARQAERCAKWEWSSEFLAKARPDKAGVGNYGAGDYFDDGLTVLERNQIASGKESFLTGGAKAAYRARTGQF